jgi:hypothetical protein
MHCSEITQASQNLDTVNVLHSEERTPRSQTALELADPQLSSQLAVLERTDANCNASSRVSSHNAFSE